MALFLFPQETANRLQPVIDRILSVCDGELFAPETRGMTVGFSKEETAGFAATGRVLAFAVVDRRHLVMEIPAKHGELINYIEIADDRVLTKLDPFYSRTNLR